MIERCPRLTQADCHGCPYPTSCATLITLFDSALHGNDPDTMSEAIHDLLERGLTLPTIPPEFLVLNLFPYEAGLDTSCLQAGGSLQ